MSRCLLLRGARKYRSLRVFILQRVQDLVPLLAAGFWSAEDDTGLYGTGVLERAQTYLSGPRTIHHKE